MAAKMWGEDGSSAGGKNGAKENLDGLGRSWMFLDVPGQVGAKVWTKARITQRAKALIRRP